MNQPIYRIIAGLMLLVLAAGCGSASTDKQTATQVPKVTLIVSTLTPEPPTATPEPTMTPTITPSPTPEWPMKGVVVVENLNMRTGPSTAYTYIAGYPENTTVAVLATAPGGEWVRVETPDDKTGWMYVNFLDLNGDVDNLPREEITDSLIVSGKVIDSSGESIEGIDVAVIHRMFDSVVQINTLSNKYGEFYAYIPPVITGAWEVQIVGISCDSRIVNSSCSLSGYFNYNNRAYLELPPPAPVVFMYEISTTVITGTVVNEDGQTVSMRVFAERDDGASSHTVSSSSGDFELPASVGSWEIYTLELKPRVEGERVSVDIVEGEEPELVELLAPE